MLPDPAPALDSRRARTALAALPAGPVAAVLAEDRAMVAETAAHLLALGFAAILVLREDRLRLPAVPGTLALSASMRGREDAVRAANRLHALLPDRWLHLAFNGEFLIFPFCETRSIGDLAAFCEEERRLAVFTRILDLYDDGDGPLDQRPETAWFDRTGHWGRQVWEEGRPLERQWEIHGGLAWRHETHVPEPFRRRDRAALYRVGPGLVMRPDFRLIDPERNTVECAWHRSPTAALASFRTAKALRRNPRSAGAARRLVWEGSARFEGTSRQLLELGFIEAGQWF